MKMESVEDEDDSYRRRMSEDLLEFAEPLSYAVVCFSTGYFVHDTLDILFAGSII